MAVPTVGNWQQQLLKGWNAPVTPQNLNILNAWQRAEGANASNNPFNTTMPGVPGSTIYNTLPSGGHVYSYPTPQAGIQATISTLLAPQYASGYQPILKALRQSSPQAFVTALGNSPWGSSASLVSQILAEGGNVAPSANPGNVPSASLPPGQPAAPGASPRLPVFNMPPAPAPPVPITQGVFPSSSSSVLPSPGSFGNSDILGSAARALGMEPLTPRAPSYPPTSQQPSFLPPPLTTRPGSSQLPAVSGKVKIGDPIPIKYQTEVSTGHPTEGLPGFWAHDYMAPAGTPTVAPVTGKVIKLSGHDPANGPTEGAHGPFGWSVYVQGNNGRIYYMTHMGSRDVQLGEKVRAGQPIGTVGNYARWTGTPDHIHMGVGTTL